MRRELRVLKTTSSGDGMLFLAMKLKRGRIPAADLFSGSLPRPNRATLGRELATQDN
jgi:hypothetical protein